MNLTEFFKSIWYSFLNGHTRQVLLEVADLFITLWPYLVIGILISSLVKIYFTERTVKKFFENRKIGPLLIASCLGVISPLGAYVTLPLIASFYALGTPLAPLIAFSVASPLINPAIFFLTQGTLGTEMAIARVVSALFLGISAGMATRFFILRFPESFQLKSVPSNKSFEQKIGKGNLSLSLFVNETYRYTRYIFKYFALGIFIAALVKVLIPANLIADFLGTNSKVSILLATAAGVPLYSCGGAALPVLKELLYLGVGKGAILAFCISGPAIKLSTIVLLNTIFRKGVLILYLSIGIVGALFLGFIYQLI
jgi:uncharacterized protein